MHTEAHGGFHKLAALRQVEQAGGIGAVRAAVGAGQVAAGGERQPQHPQGTVEQVAGCQFAGGRFAGGRGHGPDANWLYCRREGRSLLLPCARRSASRPQASGAAARRALSIALPITLALTALASSRPTSTWKMLLKAARASTYIWMDGFDSLIPPPLRRVAGCLPPGNYWLALPRELRAGFSSVAEVCDNCLRKS